MIGKFSRLSLSIFSLQVYGCTSELIDPATASRSASVEFTEEVHLGDSERNPSTPFLRYAPDGRLFAVWTEEHDKPWPNGRPTGHQHGGDRAASPLRNAMVAASVDGGKTWSVPRRVNSAVEAVQGEENGPKIAVGADKRALHRLVDSRRERRQDPRQYSLRHGRRQRRLHAGANFE